MVREEESAYFCYLLVVLGRRVVPHEVVEVLGDVVLGDYVALALRELELCSGKFITQGEKVSQHVVLRQDVLCCDHYTTPNVVPSGAVKEIVVVLVLAGVR